MNVNVAEYLKNRQERMALLPDYRKMCMRCRQPDFSCYCSGVSSFDPNIEFVILNHPIEMRRRIATGRMSHLCLKNSRLIVGHNFTENDEVNSLIEDPAYHCVMLYPGFSSVNLTGMALEAKKALFPNHKKLAVFVVDGTWSTARQMAWQSLNLRKMRRICFVPTTPSTFRVRKQPKEFCYSTIEAIHHTIELLGEARGLDMVERKHDRLLRVFNQMVERQLELSVSGGRSLRLPASQGA